MKTQRQQVEEYLNAEFFGHPSREEQEKIKRLEEMVIQLAGQIDILHKVKQQDNGEDLFESEEQNPFLYP